eukprot:Sspe_Gene.40149::Locus_19370_Transcript_1_1_Confidence_1.000_Length_619::g.40149::m.40149
MDIPAAFIRSSVLKSSLSHCSSFHVDILCDYASDSRTFGLPLCVHRSHIPASRHGHPLVHLHLSSSHCIVPYVVILHDIAVVRSTPGLSPSSSAPFSRFSSPSFSSRPFWLLSLSLSLPVPRPVVEGAAYLQRHQALRTILALP